MAGLWRRLLKAAALDHNAPEHSSTREGPLSEIATPAKKHTSFAQFYPFYLSEHSDRTCRRLHFAGSSLSLLFLATAVATASWWWLLAAVVVGYAFAWVGHFGFEQTKPASFKRPLYSFMSDWV